MKVTGKWRVHLAQSDDKPQFLNNFSYLIKQQHSKISNMAQAEPTKHADREKKGQQVPAHLICWWNKLYTMYLATTINGMRSLNISLK